jgi:hypothetical protein
MSELEAIVSAKGVKAEVVWGSKAEPIGEHMNPWTVTLRYKGRRLTVPFFTGMAWTKEPSAADVLSCIVSDASAAEQGFEDFCADFGYDSDSRQAERIYKACERLAPKVKRLLGDDFEEFQRASH